MTSDSIAYVTSEMIFVIQECKIYLKQFQFHATTIFSCQIQGIQSCYAHISISFQYQKVLE